MDIPGGQQELGFISLAGGCCGSCSGLYEPRAHKPFEEIWMGALFYNATGKPATFLELKYK